MGIDHVKGGWAFYRMEAGRVNGFGNAQFYILGNIGTSEQVIPAKAGIQ